MNKQQLADARSPKHDPMLFDVFRRGASGGPKTRTIVGRLNELVQYRGSGKLVLQCTLQEHRDWCKQATVVERGDTA